MLVGALILSSIVLFILSVGMHYDPHIPPLVKDIVLGLLAAVFCCIIIFAPSPRHWHIRKSLYNMALQAKAVRLSETAGHWRGNRDQAGEVWNSKTCRKLLTYSPSRLASLTGIDPDGVSKLFEKARNRFEKDGLRVRRKLTGLELAREQETRQLLSTGNVHIDRLFGGGLEFGETTEVYGEFGCGKTQFCHQMVVRAAIKMREMRVAWIDTESTFIPDRIRSIVMANSNDAGAPESAKLAEEILDRVDVYPVIKLYRPDAGPGGYCQGGYPKTVPSSH